MGTRFAGIAALLGALALSLALARNAAAAILWSDLGTTTVHESGEGADISGGPIACRCAQVA